MKKANQKKTKEAKEFLLENSASLSGLPPELSILDDFDVLDLLKISKRKLAQLRADREIEFHPTGKLKGKSKKLVDAINVKSKGKRAGKIYYTLKGVIDYVKTSTVMPIFKQKNL